MPASLVLKQRGKDVVGNDFAERATKLCCVDGTT